MKQQELKTMNETTPHFAEKFGFHQCVWIFVIGAFLGVIIEMLFCLVRNGYIESRTGLVILQLNPVYGFGALGMAVGLHRLENRSNTVIFIGGIVIGTIVEYAASFIQQLLVGSTSWDYSQMAFSLHGRVNLLYSIFWGILAIFWIKDIYPFLHKLILKIPNIYGKKLTWIVLFLVVVVSLFSVYAVNRWNKRINHEQVSNSALGQYTDKRFTDEKMEKIYPNMVFH